MYVYVKLDGTRCIQYIHMFYSIYQVTLVTLMVVWSEVYIGARMGGEMDLYQSDRKHMRS